LEFGLEAYSWADGWRSSSVRDFAACSEAGWCEVVRSWWPGRSRAYRLRAPSHYVRSSLYPEILGSPCALCRSGSPLRFGLDAQLSMSGWYLAVPCIATETALASRPALLLSYVVLTPWMLAARPGMFKTHRGGFHNSLSILSHLYNHLACTPTGCSASKYDEHLAAPSSLTQHRQ
jgi:hypothetical protein